MRWVSQIPPREPPQIIRRGPVPGTPPALPPNAIPRAPQQPRPPQTRQRLPPTREFPRRQPPAPPRRPPAPRYQSQARQSVPPWPPPPAAPTTKRRRRRSRVVLALLLVLVAGAVGFGVWVDTSLRRITVFGAEADRPAAGRGTTWLLVGSDSRQSLSAEQQAELSTGSDVDGNRTDTMLLVHVPGVGSSAPATMVSIPRDSYVEIPGYSSDKINTAYSLGGAPLLAQTVEQATGLRLDHYAEVGFGGFAEVVDAVGGVPMCLAAPVDDPLAGINLTPGCQELGGAAALGYVRSRATARADLDRMVNQRAFVSALVKRVTSPAVWLNPLRWYGLTRSGLDALSVDDDAHIWDLARLGLAMHGDMTTTTVPISGYLDNGSGSVVEWDSEASARLFDALASDSAVPQDVLDAAP
ncbi:MAG: LCP family protein [Mycobacterium sp.]